MQNDKDFENALRGAYEERVVPPAGLSEKVLKTAADRDSVRQARMVSLLSVVIVVFFAVLARLLIGATLIFYVVGIYAITIIIGIAALMVFYPILSKSTQGV